MRLPRLLMVNSQLFCGSTPIMISVLTRGARPPLRCLIRPRQTASRPFGSSLRDLVSHHASKSVPKSRTPKNPVQGPGKIHKAIKDLRTNSLPQPTVQYQTYASQLAQKDSPTLLYTAPSHRFFILASYGGATFCLLYAIFNFNANVLHPPEGLHYLIPYAFGSVCFLMSMLGGYLALSPARIIRSIVAIPNKSIPGGLQIQVELRKMLPIPEWVFPRRILAAVPPEMSLEHKLYVTPAELETRLTPLQRLRIKKEREEEIARQDEIERSKILTAPFRHASTAFRNLLRDAGRTFNRSGFLKVDVKGQIYKLDITGGWALDEGKSIDRLIQVKQKTY